MAGDGVFAPEERTYRVIDGEVWQVWYDGDGNKHMAYRGVTE